MKSIFSKTWKSSTQPRKQRKYRHNAPLHVQSHFLHAHLDKPLREKFGVRAIRVKKGDSVKIVRGSYKGKTGKVERVSVQYSKVYVTGIDNLRKDGSKALIPIEPSNVIITELDMSDKIRSAKLQKTDKLVSKKATPTKSDAKKAPLKTKESVQSETKKTSEVKE